MICPQNDSIVEPAPLPTCDSGLSYFGPCVAAVYRLLKVGYAKNWCCLEAWTAGVI